MRAGAHHLFEEEYYDKVFPNADATYYLPRYWAMKIVGRRAGSDRSYAKWLVLGFLIKMIKREIATPRKAKSFYRELERKKGKTWEIMERIAETIFVAATGFYKAYRKGDGVVLDVSQFYRNRLGRHKEFEDYWARRDNRNRKRLGEQIKKLRERMSQVR